jgi:hypothetical protein
MFGKTLLPPSSWQKNMQVRISQSTWHDIPEDCDLNIHCNENFKSDTGNVIVLYILIITFLDVRWEDERF